MRLQRILVDFVKQCGDLPQPRLLVWWIVPDRRAVQALAQPQQALDALVPSAEQRALGRMCRRLERLCGRRRPSDHPLTSPAGIRLQGAAAQAVLGRWFQVTGLAEPQLAVLGRYGSLPFLLRDLLVYGGAPLELATIEKLRREIPGYVRWAEIQFARPDTCYRAHAGCEELVREIRRRAVRNVVPQAFIEKEVQRTARNRIAVAMFWQANSILLDRTVARSLEPSGTSADGVDAAWERAAERLQGCLKRALC